MFECLSQKSVRCNKEPVCKAVRLVFSCQRHFLTLYSYSLVFIPGTVTATEGIMDTCFRSVQSMRRSV